MSGSSAGRVSVVIPAYNDARYVGDAVRSAFGEDAHLVGAACSLHHADDTRRAGGIANAQTGEPECLAEGAHDEQPLVPSDEISETLRCELGVRLIEKDDTRRATRDVLDCRT